MKVTVIRSGSPSTRGAGTEVFSLFFLSLCGTFGLLHFFPKGKNVIFLYFRWFEPTTKVDILLDILKSHTLVTCTFSSLHK